MMKPSKKYTNCGFTLIEMLVAVTVFALIVGSVTGLFVAAVRSQTKALFTQKLLDETSFAMEYMSRALRMAKKDLAGPSCLTTCGAGCNYENPSGLSSIKFIRFIDPLDVCQEFQLAVDRLQETRDGSIFGDLTSADFEVSALQFDLSGEAQPPTDNLQPRVTISMTIKKAGATGPEIKIQTSVSQRNLDTTYLTF